MKRGSNKTIIIICVLCFLFLTGYGFWETIPKLINANKPFIDLAGSVGESIGNANSAYEKAQLTPIPDDPLNPSVTPEPTKIPDDEKNNGEIKVVIGDTFLSGSGEKITVNSEVLESIDRLYEFLINPELEGKKVLLIDHYAETNAYKAAEECIKRTGKQYEKKRVTDSDIDGLMVYQINR